MAAIILRGQGPKEAIMSVLRLVDRESITVPPQTTAKAAIQLMLDRRVGSVVVVEGEKFWAFSPSATCCESWR